MLSIAQHEKTMTGVVQNLIHQGKMDEAEWTKHNVKTLVNTFSHMGSAFLARQIMDTTHRFCVNKNWNSHGAQEGATICQLGSILASLKNASNQRLLSTHFPKVKTLRGCVQTGAKHGNHDVTYVKYMCAAIENRLVVSGKELYLNHIKFRKENHAEENI